VSLVQMPRHGDDGVQQQRQLAAAAGRGGWRGAWSYESRWLCLATGCAMQVCAGAVYSFGSVAEDLKHNLELNDAHEQGLISIAGNLGLWVGSFTGGILADARGPRASMLGGAGLFFVGYGAMYLALSHRVTALRDPTTVAFFYLLAGLGSGWVMNSVRSPLDTSTWSIECTAAAALKLELACVFQAMFTNTQNWEPARRAKVVSILATLMGAAATIWSTLYTGCLGGHVEQSYVTAAVSGTVRASSDTVVAPPPSLGGLAINGPPPYAYSPYFQSYEDDYVLPEGSTDGGGATTDGQYDCAGGWVNGDVASFFGLLAVVPPVITLFGAWASFRMENDQQRRLADVQDGGDGAITRRLGQGVRALVAVLFAVGLSGMLAVVFDGDAGAVHVNQWAPLLMLGLLGLLVALLGGEQDLVDRCWRWWKVDSDHDLAGLQDKSSTTAAVAAAAVTAATSAAQHPRLVAATVHTPRTALYTIEFWLVFCVMATVCGSNSATMVGILFHIAGVGSVSSMLCLCLFDHLCAAQNVISTIINDRHAGSRVVARITNVLLMTTSSLIRILSGQLMAAAPGRPVHVWIVLLSSVASMIGQGLFTVSSRAIDRR
jgi:MFS family permease